MVPINNFFEEFCCKEKQLQKEGQKEKGGEFQTEEFFYIYIFFDFFYAEHIFMLIRITQQRVAK